MKLAKEASFVLKKLLIKDALLRLWHRLQYWLVILFLLYSSLLCAGFFIPYPSMVFYASLLVAAGFLPAFVFWPEKEEPFLDLVKRIDYKMAIEAWLEYKKGPLSLPIKKQAEETLRTKSDFYKFKKAPKPFITYCSALALAIFIISQSVSLYKGYGYSFKKIDIAKKSTIIVKPEIAQEDKIELSHSEEAVLNENIYSKKQKSFERSEAKIELSEDFFAGLPSEFLAEENNGSEKAQERSQGKGQIDSENSDTAKSPSESFSQKAAQKQAGTAGKKGIEEGEEAPNNSMAESGKASAKGSGQALQADPIPNYQAIFEKAYIDKTGKVAALAEKGDPAFFNNAITQYFGSFDLNISLNTSLEHSLEQLKHAWIKAMKEAE